MSKGMERRGTGRPHCGHSTHGHSMRLAQVPHASPDSKKGNPCCRRFLSAYRPVLGLESPGFRGRSIPVGSQRVIAWAHRGVKACGTLTALPQAFVGISVGTGTVWGHFWGHEGTGMPPDTGGTVALELKELLRVPSCQSGSAAFARGHSVACRRSPTYAPSMNWC